MSDATYLATICIFFGTVLLIFVIRAQVAIRAARLESTKEASYRAIAEQAMAAQEATAAALADLKVRIIAIEKVLKEVE